MLRALGFLLVGFAAGDNIEILPRWRALPREKSHISILVTGSHAESTDALRCRLSQPLTAVLVGEDGTQEVVQPTELRWTKTIFHKHRSILEFQAQLDMALFADVFSLDCEARDPSGPLHTTVTLQLIEHGPIVVDRLTNQVVWVGYGTNEPELVPALGVLGRAEVLFEPTLPGPQPIRVLKTVPSATDANPTLWVAPLTDSFSELDAFVNEPGLVGWLLQPTAEECANLETIVRNIESRDGSRVIFRKCDESCPCTAATAAVLSHVVHLVTLKVASIDDCPAPPPAEPLRASWVFLELSGSEWHQTAYCSSVRALLSGYTGAIVSIAADTSLQTSPQDFALGVWEAAQLWLVVFSQQLALPTTIQTPVLHNATEPSSVEIAAWMTKLEEHQSLIVSIANPSSHPLDGLEFSFQGMRSSFGKPLFYQTGATRTSTTPVRQNLVPTLWMNRGRVTTNVPAKSALILEFVPLPQREKMLQI